MRKRKSGEERRKAVNKITTAEKWFGKKKKDLTAEELKEFWRLEAEGRRKLPKVQEYRKQYQKQYKKDHKEKINQSIKDWKQNNPEKVKSYRYAKLNREIEVLKRALKETTDLMQNYLMEKLELQEKLANTENDHINDKLYKQDHKTAVLERALELACGVLKLDGENDLGIGFGDVQYYCDNYLKNRVDGVDRYKNYFKSQAESDIKKSSN